MLFSVCVVNVSSASLQELLVLEMTRLCMTGVLVLVFLHVTAAALQLQTGKNFRLALPNSTSRKDENRLIFRSGHFDDICESEAKDLIGLDPLTIDLRNHGEGSQSAMAQGT